MFNYTKWQVNTHEWSQVKAILWWGQHCGWSVITQSDRCTHMSDHNSHSNPLMRTTLWSVITCALPLDKPEHCADTLQDQKQDRSCSGLGQWFCFPVLGFAFSITPSALFYIFSATFLFFFLLFFDCALYIFSMLYHIFWPCTVYLFYILPHFRLCSVQFFYILPHFFTVCNLPFLYSPTFFHSVLRTFSTFYHIFSCLLNCL